MPQTILDNDDLIKAIEHLTEYKYNIKRIIYKEIDGNGDLKITWKWS